MVDTDEPHLLVVDDDERIRTLLSRFLAAQGFRVTSAENAADAAAKMASVSFDLLIVDVMMPGQSGFDFVADLRRRQDHVPVILLTARGEAEDRIKGLETGADDYLPKPFEPRELTLRINAILKRAVRPAPAAAAKPVTFGDLVFDPVRGDLRRGEEIVPLTTGEAQLLRILAKAPGTTVSRAALAEPGTNGESRAVDVQITRLRRKIEPDPRNPRYLQTVWGEGYVLWTD
ncbi:MAG TPA: response regulator [Ferrovibrio sp.]|jgi:two-component system phosphate regulon response regulator OmpR|uniref:response regulator n=1 Tax=Ferrovibrio sp. TaxID=1917215 RepID=UPI002B4AF426|nr:response regulator [Ferrovibrio sp.]HLT76044.1 response regulator [Ferrovibrio sp.]